jgi:hypothetical protein
MMDRILFLVKPIAVFQVHESEKVGNTCLCMNSRTPPLLIYTAGDIF